MAKTRSSRNKEEAKKQTSLPDLWVTHFETSRSGRIVNSYYLNLKTRQKFYSKAAFYEYFRQMTTQNEASLNRETLAEEEKDHICSRCKEIGHNCINCLYPIIYKINPFAGKRIRRCSRCHCLGHNVRTCLRAV